jgi:S-DNA-T family DNA segregation ATPase FtsK/SpoIIIE
MKIPLFNNENEAKKKPARNVKKGAKPQEAKGKKSKKAKKADLDFDLKKFSFSERWEDERFRSSVGIITITISIFLFISIFSSLFSGTEDMLFTTNPLEDGTEYAENKGGNLGALFSYYVVRRSFGIGTFILPFIMFLLGVRWLTGTNLLPLGKSFRWSLFAMIVLPWTIDMLFRDHVGDFIYGNASFYLSTFLDKYVGSFASYSLLVATYAIALTIVYPKWIESIKSENLQKIVSKLKSFFKLSNVNIDDMEEGSIIPESSPIIEDEPEEENLEAIIDDFLDGPSEKETTSESLAEDTPKPEPVDTSAATADSSNEDGKDLDFEVKEKKEEDTVDENEIVQEYGEYDPTLELSKYQMPGLDHLVDHGDGKNAVGADELQANKEKIIETLQHYKIEISKITAEVGPTVTLYEIVPAPGVRISKIQGLEKDIALSLAALGIRIIAPIPGRGTVGIEVPNTNPDVVSMLALIKSEKFQKSDAELPIALGKTISNETHVFDLAKMPHLLMAGATGQGKSVGLNAMLVSLLYRKHPSTLKFVLVDPKKVELSVYNHISRHYLAQLPDAEDSIITDTDKVVNTLYSLCKEMDQRYDLLKDAQCRNIKEYNAKFINRKIVPGSCKEAHPERGHHFLPYIVLVVDEFADLIMTAGKEVETPIARLAQLARAIGIHLIIATQRPSVKIITGTIKANFPGRVAFRVTSAIDSRTILDASGADQLIGRGDLLMSTGNDLIRLQCGFVDTPEVESICNYIGAQRGYPEIYELPEYVPEGGGATEKGATSVEERDVLFNDAASIVVMHQQGSTSLVQRKLKVGYNRAGRIIDQLEDAGIIGPFEGSKARKVLIPDELSLEQLLNRPLPGDDSAGDKPF